jgi:hypothetical protein
MRGNVVFKPVPKQVAEVYDRYIEGYNAAIKAIRPRSSHPDYIKGYQDKQKGKTLPNYLLQYIYHG